MSFHLLLNPGIGLLQPVAQRTGRCPVELCADKPIVGIAPADAGRTSHIPLYQVLSGDITNHVNELIDRYHLSGADIERLQATGEAREPQGPPPAFASG